MWQKKGAIFNSNQNYDWMVSHACVPTAVSLTEETIRIYFATRNSNGLSIPTFIDVSGKDPSKVLYLHDRPILPLGKPGTFDDCGIMPFSVVEHEEHIYLYYVGWNTSLSVPYRQAIGLAVSNDRGLNFKKVFEGPIVDRNELEPYFTNSPYVFKDANRWHMWYGSTIRFILVNNKQEPQYIIKYAFSTDGIRWVRENITCIYPKTEYEANARPSVLKENGLFKMWFTYRGCFAYRDGKDSYRIGYAESKDAINWVRKDELASIDVSEEGWDSKMIAYPCVLKHNEKKYLFYNGNGFGKTGIGYAIYQ